MNPMKPYEDIDRIEDYLDGSMTPAEASEFQSRLESDPQLAELYHQRLKLQHTWKASEPYLPIHKMVRSAMIRERSSMNFRRIILLVAASFVVLIGLGSVLLFILPEKPEEKMQLAVTTDTIHGPQQTGIPKYGKVDTISSAKSGEIILLSPAESAIYYQGDTIHFRWKAASGNQDLIIRGKHNDSVIFKMNLPLGTGEAQFETRDLKKGTYWWYINDRTIQREFIIKMQSDDEQ
jgi:hypothetical protein